jgi:hypothetical protein
MKTIATIALAGFAAAATAGPVLDQNQPDTNTYMAGFNQTDLAQSFMTDAGSIAGAGIFLEGGVGNTDTVRISLYDALPDEGGSLLAQASTQGTQGQWVDVFWNEVIIAADTTYFLVFDGNTTLGIAGDTNNPYADGMTFANAGFNSFSNFDYTFRTWSSSIPTPGAAAALAVAGLGIARRRR